MIHDNQQAYYDATNRANDEAKSTVFIEFMLSIIKSAILETIDTAAETHNEATDKASVRCAKIQRYLKTHDFIMNADLRELCGVSSATANQILNGLAEEGALRKYHEGRYWAYCFLRKRQ